MRQYLGNEDYYTAGEAIKKLGLSKTEFHRKVNSGQIPKCTQTGRKHGVYRKKDIDALAEAMHIVFEVPPKFEFTKSSPGEQKEEMEIGIRCFGREYITPLSERIDFQLKNDFTFWSLKVDGSVAGYISMFRFIPEFLNDILTGKQIERDITVREVLQFTRFDPFDIYIDVLAFDPLIPLTLRKFYANILVLRFIDMLLSLLGHGYKIRTIYTATATAEGDHLVRKIGFHLMEGKSLAPGRTAYEFKLNDKGIQRLRELSRSRI